MTDPPMASSPATFPIIVRGRRTPLDYLFFLRPVLLVPVWTIALLGTVAASPHAPLGAGRWLILFSQLSCLAGGIYTFNQICDVESDRLNRKLHFLAAGIISPRAAWVFTVALDCAALVGAACLARRYFALTILSIGLGIVYSAGRKPWKNRPGLALGANALGHGACVHLLGILAVTSSLTLPWTLTLGYALAVGAVYLATTVPDMPGDRATGKITLAVCWGGQRAMLLATLLVLGAIACAGVGRDWYLAGASFVSLPFFTGQ
ncbi:MAG: UbiA family prenyltransferase [candidate division Zixibacteria bacterium]|nr:UbiA family prenyltransferase [candidate division Zixibacteria bacterium]